ncbi:MAG TPA: DUF5916 domain-containing protein [Candidatus Angelobacter sp.]|nr:DUF5916 domain-containing protein [Candidatus Angelobacter sp.]
MLQLRCLRVVLVLSSALATAQLASRPSSAISAAGMSVPEIPKLAGSPKLLDFEGMQPATELARSMLKIDKFTQRDPHDGAPASQRTEAYLGYTDKDFYAVFLAFDSEPKKIRARMLRRELIDDDDQVGMYLDTFHDRRHAYYFYSNPYGIQQDGLFAESGGPDNSFDTVWHTDAKMTPQGYMVVFEIPFKSLRFPQSPSLSWGVFLVRVIPRNSEHSFYPVNTTKIQGWLTQAGTIQGFHDISPGRNLQFIPYSSLGAFRDLDPRDPAGDRFSGKHVAPKAGLDSKVVIKDSLVLDTTINPDFGQIESDDPQVTVNQRFEVFFPEKRPFFQENSNYFQTPLNLVFTRRIVDPLYGTRLTGKIGPWALGTFLADDRAPGKSVIETDPLFGNHANVGVLRINREIGKNNSVGFIYTDRELHTDPASFCTASPCVVGFNRVGGFDTQIKINQNWQMNAQAVTSETKLSDGTHQAGPAFQVFLERSSRAIEFNSVYQDISPGFNTDLGFVPRNDLRLFNNFFAYTFHPDGKLLVSHGPRVSENTLWDHNGTRLSYFLNGNYQVQLPGQTFLGWFSNIEREQLRPSDFPALPQNRDYPHHVYGPFFNSQILKWITINGEVDMGTATNFVPRTGPPIVTNFTAANLRSTVRPLNGLTIENSYLLTRLVDQQSRLNIFNNHIIRSKWNYQFTKEFSLRLIGQYTTTISNPGLTTLQASKNFNGDALFTYMLTPGTAIYAGYNSNLQNLDPSLFQTPDGLLRTRKSFINDGRQFFIKVSYLFRY